MNRYPWPEDEGELQYPSYQLGYGSYQPAPAPEAPKYGVRDALKDASPMASSSLGPAGLALGVVGTGLNAYGSYEASKDADRDYQLQKDAYEFDKAISLEDRERQEEERRRRAMLEAGNYAGDFLDKNIRGYGSYNAMRG